MPNTDAAESFIRRAARIEQQATHAAADAWQQARAALSDTLAANPQRLLAVLPQISAAIGAATRAHVTEAAPAARSYVAAQIVTSYPPIPQNVAQQTTALDLSAWQSAAAGRFLADAGRLAAAGESADTIAVQLVATTASRESAWLWAGRALQLAVEGALWQQINATLRHEYVAVGTDAARRGIRYQKQLIAALDRRTTNCCLSAHGQIVDLDRPFLLSGTPRYADRMQQPPFHPRCRSVIALYTPALEAIGTPTAQMRADARALLQSSRTR